ncbi:protein disulfide-isomerase A4 [Hydra vulgaris]|uniref:protein disulfide-isomerase A4 n=1 Tax=Hydra vulgaris TaxID=6087 RepID=UPI00064122A7|nr:protein disulfide-isomerase A4 [Hydra vulgaris]
MMAKSATCLALCLLFITIQCEDVPSDKPLDESSENIKQVVDEPVEEDHVIILSDKNFDGFINSKKFVLVEFYAPWCGHCKQLAPEYSKAAQKLKNNDPPVSLAKVDCTKETELANRFNIQGYPTIKLFKDGEPSDYDGERDENGIVKYMRQHADPNYVPPKDFVIVLGKDNFTEITEKEAIMLVEFYAPWCGHCKKIAPQLEKAASALQSKQPSILIGKVDATIEKELAEQYGVTGYPTMKIFRNGKATEYKGPREEPGIADYMLNQAGDPTKLYETMTDVKKFLKSNLDEPVILGVFDSKDDPLYKLYIDSNNAVRDDYVFGHTFAADAKHYFGLKVSSIIIAHPEYLLTQYEPKYRAFDDASGNDIQVQAFYKEYCVPLVGHYQQHIESRFSKRPLVLVFYDVNFQPEFRSMTQFWRNKVVPVARKYKNALFAVADETMFEHKLKELGLSDSGETVNVGIYNDKGQRFAMKDEEFNEETLEEFLEDFYKGKLKPVIKSQAVPKKVNPGNVQVVVGKTFDSVVMDESKEVFIEFYAPWCGHCKKLEPVIVKLAKKFKNEKNIVIAKIDATENEAHAAYEVSGYPTIYYALPGKKDKPIKMDGGRELSDLVKFIEENSVVLKSKNVKQEL